MTEQENIVFGAPFDEERYCPELPALVLDVRLIELLNLGPTASPLALEAEERAMKRSSLWGELRVSFAQRRRALETQAAWRMPPAPRATPPRPVSAPFDAVVEAVEWEPPTVPTQRGERPEHAARVTLVQVLR